MPLYKAKLRYTGPAAPHLDGTMVAGVSEAGARAYALSKHHVEGDFPGQFYICEADPWDVNIPKDYVEPTVSPSESASPATADSIQPATDPLPAEQPATTDQDGE